MSSLVLDASMTLSWLLPDEENEASIGVQSELAKAEGAVAGQQSLLDNLDATRRLQAAIWPSRPWPLPTSC